MSREGCFGPVGDLFASEQIDKGRVEKLALTHEVWVLKNNLGNHEKDEELRVEASRQSDRYDELWRAHGVLLEEAQKLRLQAIILSSEIAALVALV